MYQKDGTSLAFRSPMKYWSNSVWPSIDFVGLRLEETAPRGRERRAAGVRAQVEDRVAAGWVDPRRYGVTVIASASRWVLPSRYMSSRPGL